MTACVVVLVYRAKPERHEVVSLTQLAGRMGERTIELVAPAGLELRRYRSLVGEREAQFFDPSFFQAHGDSPASYSALIVSEAFYERFERYEHVLVHQTDAFVFENQLVRWTQRELDYVGSPHCAQWVRARTSAWSGSGTAASHFDASRPSFAC